MKSFLLSWLAQRHAGDGLTAFKLTHAGPWLVWEAGPWRPPPADRATILAVSPDRRPTSGDALVLEVAARAGRPRLEGVRLGRGPENDIVVDDGTLSRAHLLLRQEDGGWTLEDLGSSNGTRVDGQVVRGGRVAVATGSRIEAGGVRLTFYDADGLFLRIKRAVV